jgi:hypothetical protein
MRAGIAQSLQVATLGFDSRERQDFLFSTMSRQLCGPPSLMSNGYLVYLSPGIKRKEREVDHSLPSNAEVKNGEAIPALPHMPSWHSNSFSSSAYMD